MAPEHAAQVMPSIERVADDMVDCSVSVCFCNRKLCWRRIDVVTHDGRAGDLSFSSALHAGALDAPRCAAVTEECPDENAGFLSSRLTPFAGSGLDTCSQGSRRRQNFLFCDDTPEPISGCIPKAIGRAYPMLTSGLKYGKAAGYHTARNNAKRFYIHFSTPLQ